MREKNRKANSSEPSSSFFDHAFRPIFISILSLSGSLYAVLNFKYNTGLYNDDAVYVITAKDFWNTLKAHPLLELKPDFPLPGLPLFLKPFALVAGHNWTSLEWVSVLVTISVSFLLGMWLKKRLTPAETLSVVALYALHPLVAHFSGILMPSPYYSLFLVSSLFLMDSYLENPTTKKSLALGFILGWSSLTRPHGVILLVCVLGPLAFSKNRRGKLAFALIPILFWAVFGGLWFHVRQASRTEYGPDLWGLATFWRHNPGAALNFLTNWFGSYLTEFWPPLRNSAPLWWPRWIKIILGAHLLVGAVGAVELWKRKCLDRLVLIALGLFSIFSVLIHTYWFVPDPRYLLPLLPGLAIAFVVFGSRQAWAKMALGLVLLIYAQGNGLAIYQMVDKPDPLNKPPWKCLTWIKEHADSNAKIISNISPSIDLYTNRPASVLFNAGDANMLDYLLMSRGFQYLVLRGGAANTTGVGSTENLNLVWSRYRRWVKLYPDQFPCVLNEPDEQTAIYRVADVKGLVPAYKKFISASYHSQQNQNDVALQELKDSLRLNPNLGCSLNFLGALYLLRNENTLAEEAFLKSFRSLPDSPNALLNLGSLYMREGQKEKSRQYLQKAIDLLVANGEESVSREKIVKLQQKWEHGDCDLFIDYPNASLYSEMTTKTISSGSR